LLNLVFSPATQGQVLRSYIHPTLFPAKNIIMNGIELSIPCLEQIEGTAFQAIFEEAVADKMRPARFVFSDRSAIKIADTRASIGQLQAYPKHLCDWLAGRGDAGYGFEILMKYILRLRLQKKLVVALTPAALDFMEPAESFNRVKSTDLIIAEAITDNGIFRPSCLVSLEMSGRRSNEALTQDELGLQVIRISGDDLFDNPAEVVQGFLTSSDPVTYIGKAADICKKKLDELFDGIS